MFLEASAIVELITGGPRASDMSSRMNTASGLFFTGPTVEFEATAAVARIKRCSTEAAHQLVLQFVEAASAERMTITPEIGEQAIAAFAKYGKGRHAARLNFGDCFSYAMAKAAGVPLLYVGDDFAQTDLG